MDEITKWDILSVQLGCDPVISSVELEAKFKDWFDNEVGYVSFNLNSKRWDFTGDIRQSHELKQYTRDEIKRQHIKQTSKDTLIQKVLEIDFKLFSEEELLSLVYASNQKNI